jgi:hypothetical protein
MALHAENLAFLDFGLDCGDTESGIDHATDLVPFITQVVKIEMKRLRFAARTRMAEEIFGDEAAIALNVV